MSLKTGICLKMPKSREKLIILLNILLKMTEGKRDRKIQHVTYLVKMDSGTGA